MGDGVDDALDEARQRGEREGAADAVAAVRRRHPLARGVSLPEHEVGTWAWKRLRFAQALADMEDRDVQDQ